jgi:pyrimidine-nucleoside phosphorylase
MGGSPPPYWIVQRKRDGEELSASGIRDFLQAYSGGRVKDYHMAAFLMAVFFRGLSPAELAVFVETMMRSGAVADLSSIPGVKVDKHSTGGVGDKVSLVLAPLVASLGVVVPMMSGRGLGHSGGTVDKLETIPGFRTDLSLDAFCDQLARVGCALIAQTDEIAPLDRRLYALRDVTATVESIPLIASSIMSKKLAEGIDALVLDVKVGNGAFIPEPGRAEELARTMISIGAMHDREVVALMTAMDRPLGHAVGNALEVDEAIAALKGGGPPDLREVTLALAAEMLVLAKVAATVTEGRAQAAAALDDGRALEAMKRIVAAQGGDVAVLEDPGRLPAAPVVRELRADRSGLLESMDVRAIGRAAVALGAGRASLDAAIDPAVGFILSAKPGDAIATRQPIATIHARTAAAADRAADDLRSAMRIGDGAASPLPLIGRRLDAAGVVDS